MPPVGQSKTQSSKVQQVTSEDVIPFWSACGGTFGDQILFISLLPTCKPDQRPLTIDMLHRYSRSIRVATDKAVLICVCPHAKRESARISTPCRRVVMCEPGQVKRVIERHEQSTALVEILEQELLKELPHASQSQI